jgi:hypothetical protein
MQENQFPLHEAAKRGRIAEINELLKAHDINTLDPKGNTPLHCAVSEMQDQAAIFLLERKANATLLNNDGLTPLHIYAAGGDQRGAAILNSTQAGAFSKAIYTLNAQNETPLHMAISRDNMYFFTHFIKPLGQRYYEKIDLKNPVFSSGHNNDSLVYTALKRLLNKDLEQNEDRTYTMLYLLAGEVPEMFSARRSKSTFTTQSPHEFSIEHKFSSKISVLLESANKIYLDTYSQKQLIGQLQLTLNHQTDVIEDLRREISQLKSMMMPTSPRGHFFSKLKAADKPEENAVSTVGHDNNI